MTVFIVDYTFFKPVGHLRFTNGRRILLVKACHCAGQLSSLYCLEFAGAEYGHGLTRPFRQTMIAAVQF
jgi:hypothetical protein